MEIVRLKHPRPLLKLPPTAVALGFFDGVHRGHQKVIEVAKTEAKDRGLKSAVMTFFPHPKEVLRNEEEIQYLSPLPEKIKLMEGLGIDYLFIVTFDRHFADLSPQQFVDEYLIDLNVKHVVAGFDYSYGRLGKGTMETLPFHSRKQFTQTTVKEISNGEEKISSTEIRKALSKGNIDKVNTYLGRMFQIEGLVEHGEKRGRTIGFPTANISPVERTVFPDIGVYTVFIQVDGEWLPGVCNVGFKPTFHNNSPVKPTIEVHILDFQSDLYGKEVIVAFYNRIRGEKKFASVEELKQQISTDVTQARGSIKDGVRNECY
ncbi:bifunctional riboflavin kinase/FAD synthetase [Salipaludibacillus daqingensis]|uniref:bifunctional riboflavin kinase/FAD synthetase n=1 Tax=Salipaludibacillus daqingensis TaxID=3041001 RepID=UPI002475E020|nr:bifunctional riboflavin kinase/FAD synthetase [Salipaludibacillus daqingensis]